VITGGTVGVNGGTILPAGGTLSGVTYEGTLDLSAANSVLTLTGENTFTGPDGAGLATIDLNGGPFQNSTLYALGSQTLDNTTISIGNAGYGQNDLVNEGTNAILMLGSRLTLHSAADRTTFALCNG
jgi:hypothetical protein